MEGYWVSCGSVVKGEDDRPTNRFAATAEGPGGFDKATYTWNMVIPIAAE